MIEQITQYGTRDSLDIIILIVCFTLGVGISYFIEKEVELVPSLYISSIIISIAIYGEILSFYYIAVPLLCIGISIYITTRRNEFK